VQGLASSHTRGDPAHTPAWQASFWVQRLPSLHAVPSVFGVASHWWANSSHVPSVALIRQGGAVPRSATAHTRAAGVVDGAEKAVIAGQTVGLVRVGAGAGGRIADSCLVALVERGAEDGVRTATGAGLTGVGSGCRHHRRCRRRRRLWPDRSKRRWRDCRCRRRGTGRRRCRPPGSSRCRRPTGRCRPGCRRRRRRTACPCAWPGRSRCPWRGRRTPASWH